MSSEARVSTETTGTQAAVAAAVEQVLLGEKCTIDRRSPDGLTLDFTTRKTRLSWELEGQAVVSPSAQGSRIDLTLNTHHNRPTAMLDGAKNAKSAKKLMDKISAAL